MNTKTIKAPSLRDVPQGRLGMWILIAGELIIFGGLIACYLLFRFRYPEWADQAAHTSTSLGALNTFVLLFSSYCVVKAHAASLKKELKNIVTWMSITIACGLTFLVIKIIEYSSEISHGYTLINADGLGVGEIGGVYWSFYYLMTGLHALHVIAGMIILLVHMLDARKGKNLHRIELGGMYWHMVDIVWIFLFPILYLAK
jgi:heme/copper-type cytochrome/quinol oxidase subunit 3